jgi:undecaprenyl-diphosphatase
VVFPRRWSAIAQGFFGSLRGRSSDDGHLAWALVVGTIPAGLVGLWLEKPLEHLFHDLRIVALALLVNGIVLWLGGRQWR